MNNQDTIVALSTPPGIGALALIRMSGIQSFKIISQFINVQLSTIKSHSAQLHSFKIDENTIDDCILTFFKSPTSFTSEDTVEISCHCSRYIIDSILNGLINAGARLAEPGEFTMRAFSYGQLDLMQAEAIGDLIASQNQGQHQVAMSQMKGYHSSKIEELRSNLLDFGSLLELENDFGEEDVQFASRTELKIKIIEIHDYVDQLCQSFQYGNVLKNGIPIAIIGKPNAGKSTLLNQLLEEDKAIVSHIPGTTRDVIEDTTTYKGHLLRFIDTAGLRHTTDEIEVIGIQKSKEKLLKASILLLVVDIADEIREIVELFNQIPKNSHQHMIIVLNKKDQWTSTCSIIDTEEAVSTLTHRSPTISISALNNSGIDLLKNKIVDIVENLQNAHSDLLITNVRHYQNLKNALTHLSNAKENIDFAPSDILSLDLKYAIHHLDELTGKISSDDILTQIFSNFCIGK